MKAHVRVRLAASAVVLAAALLGGLGLYGLSSAIQGDDRTGNPEQDACYDLTPDQCRALHEESTADFFSKLGPWIMTIPTDEMYLRTLPQAEMMVFGDGPLGDLGSVSSAAALVVVGRGQAITFNENLSSTVRFKVDNYIKGSGPSTVDVVQSGGPLPDEDWSPTLGYVPGDQFLLPGDEAVLFLTHDPETNAHEIIVASGQYRFDDWGGLIPMPGNPFGDSVRGTSIEEFTAEIESVLEQSASASGSAP